VPSPKPKIGESLGDFEKRVSRYGVIKVIGVVALVVAAKYGLQELHHMPSTGVGIRGNNMPYVPDYPAPTVPRTDGLAQVVTTPEFSAAAHTVTPSETWFHTFKEMGITNANQQANLLHKLGPILKEKGWAYKMPDGLWGISHTGQLPDDVLELIQNSL
jgi:hypothetical protein